MSLRLEAVFGFMTNAMMKEQETNGILGFVSMWPELGRRMEVGFSDLKLDMETVVQHLKTNNVTVSVMTFTSQFSFLGEYISGLIID